MSSTIVGNFTDGSIVASDDKSGTPNSATLSRMMGDIKVSGIVNDGRAVEAFETQGALTGLRLGARNYPTVTVSAQVDDLIDDFRELINGKTAGFVSTVADIGDAVAVDLSVRWDYGANQRRWTMEDCVLTGQDWSQGSPNTVALTFTCYGPVEIDGVAYVSSR